DCTPTPLVVPFKRGGGISCGWNGGDPGRRACRFALSRYRCGRGVPGRLSDRRRRRASARRSNGGGRGGGPGGAGRTFGRAFRRASRGRCAPWVFRCATGRADRWVSFRAWGGTH